MSSMVRNVLFAALLFPAMTSSVAAGARDGSEWDRARSQLASRPAGSIQYAIDRWRSLSTSDRFAFDDYAGFLLTYPGFPEEAKLRRSAERALVRDGGQSSRTVAFFDRFPPLTNAARAHYALALATTRRPNAEEMARAAWRGGAMSDSAEATLLSLYGGRFTTADHDARIDALLWAGAIAQAERQMSFVSATARPGAMARLAMVQGNDPVALGLSTPAGALSDPGFVFNRARQYRRTGLTYAAVNLLANRPKLAALPADPDAWVEELLAVAKTAGASQAVRIAASIDDGFAPGTDISTLNFGLRDDYTSLMWLGATKALWDLRDAASAAPLFWRYGAAARTPQTRSKGFYWAGRAASRAGDTVEANRYFELAAAYPDHFYGMLALERLGRPVPRFDTAPKLNPTPAQRADFLARPLTQAVREVARGAEWAVTVRFFREICDQAQTEADHVLVAQLAQDIGRRDLGVILGQSAHTDGFGNFQHISFPLIPNPPGTDFTMVHAISRQESQFAMNAVSHAGARGLMQLMPGTAREQAGKVGLSYEPTLLTADAAYNIRLGDGYFARMMDYFGGSYPLAVAAYNAGPGNVNKFLRANGDPRLGGVDWIDWIERIPLQETRNYVQRVLENAVVYDAMNPDKASYRGPNPLSHYLGKRTTG